MIAEPTLAELAAASGLQPRTIRSWVAQDLLPAPLNRGPGARYPADTLQRLLAIRAMRDLLGMPLAAIRQELLVAGPERIAEYAAKAGALMPESGATVLAAASGTDAVDYIRRLRQEATGTAAAASPAPPPTGLDALEQALAARAADPAPRRARAEEWWRIPVTPDIEIAVRGRLDAERRAQLERCADIIRDILLGRNT